jgi:hypothetical protein
MILVSPEGSNIIVVNMVFVVGGSKGPRPDHRDTACFIVPKPEKKTPLLDDFIPSFCSLRI